MNGAATSVNPKLCDHKTIEIDQSQGTSFCTQCGAVVETNAIVSEVTFGETSAGAAMVYGSLIRAGQTRANMPGIGFKGTNQSSREITMSNARRRLQSIATALNLSSHYVDSALRYFNLSLSIGFTRGRRATHVAAVCLYIVCRKEKASVMLIDFSDVLQTNVFKIGITFLRLIQALNITLPLVDPSLYVSRFASQLEFGDKTQQVAIDALRLVQRMDRDWLQIGRRPAGICGASLLIAARMNNFRRTLKEVIQVVKVSDVTLRKRLSEFKNTPSSELTVDEFRNIWLDEAADPPAFLANRKKVRPAKAKHSNLAAVLAEDYEPAGANMTNEDRELSEEVTRYINDARERFLSYQMPEDTFDADVSKWSDVDDDEVAAVILTEEERQAKEERWMEENRAYLNERERKRKEAEELQAAGGGASGRRTQKRRKIGTNKRPNAKFESGDTALESTKKMLSVKKLSRKINYDVLDTLFDPNMPKSKAEAEEKPVPIVREIIEEPGDIEVTAASKASSPSAVGSAKSGTSIGSDSASKEQPHGEEAEDEEVYGSEEESEGEDYDEGPKLDAAAALGYSRQADDDYGYDYYNEDED